MVAAAGRRRTAFGANFLPDAFLLMKELKVAGALGAAVGLSLLVVGGGADGGCDASSSVVMAARGADSRVQCRSAGRGSKSSAGNFDQPLDVLIAARASALGY